MKTMLVTTAVLVLLTTLAACGSPTSGTSLPGTYILDVEKTQGAREATTLTGLTTAAREAQTAALEAQFAPDKYRLEVHEGGTFALHAADATGTFVLEGTWTPTELGVQLQASQVNGQPAEPDQVPPEEVRLEDIWLVLGDAGQTVYLRKQ